MRIESGYLDVALQVADDKRKSLSVEFSHKDLADYKAKLQELAKQGKYQAGDKLSSEAINVIKEHYAKLLGGMTDRFAKQSEELKRSTDVKEYIMAAHDYLFAVASKELNGAQATYYLYDEVETLFINAANTMNRERFGNELNTSECFKEQRKIDADELHAGKIGDLLNEVLRENPSPDAIGALLAQKQALEKRQQNHNAFWRFFHREENAKRTQLLKTMEEALLKHISADAVNSEHTDPKDIVNQIISKSIPKEFLQRESVNSSAQMFGYDAYKNNPQMLEKFNEMQRAKEEERQKPIDLKTFLQVGYRPNPERMEEEWNAVKPLYDAVQSKTLWSENNNRNLAIRELLSKNFIRLQLCKLKLDKDKGDIGGAKDLMQSVESNYVHEDAEFAKNNPDYTVPEIPEHFGKEKVSIDMSEDLSQKSEKIDVPVKTAPQKNLG